MAGTANANWQQYMRWVHVIARSMRINDPQGGEVAAVNVIIKAFWNVDAQTGTRPWLAAAFQRKAVSGGSDYQGDEDNEPIHIQVKMLMVIARDLDDIPLTDAEKTTCDTFFSATGDRRFGKDANLV